MGEARRRFAVFTLEDDDLDHITKGDERFFDRHPSRRYRLRLAGRAEVKSLRRVHGADAVRTSHGSEMDVLEATMRRMAGERH